MSLALGLRLFLATLFARAAWHKLSQRQNFQAELAAYRLVPPALTLPAVYVLAAAEIFCAAGILFSNIAAGVAMALLLVYGAAIHINLRRGNRHIDCGCGGWLSPRKTLSEALVVRNLLLALLAFTCLLLPVPANMTMGNLWFSLLIALVFWLLYETIEQAMSNFQHYQQWKKQSSQTGGAH